MPRLVTRSYPSETYFSTSSPPPTGFAGSELLRPRADLRCGSQNNSATCDWDPLSTCCSQYGYCGNTTEYCQVSLGCQSGCTIGSNSTANSTSTSTNMPLLTGAKIGGITVGTTIGVIALVFGLYEVWQFRRHRPKEIDTDSDLESNAAPELEAEPDLEPAMASNSTAGQVRNPPPETRMCMGCSQEKSVLAAFPRRRITASCNHEPGFCRPCLENRINLSLVQQGWDQVKCPENGCDSQLEPREIEQFASVDDFLRYQDQRQRTETIECEICYSDKLVFTELPNRPITNHCKHPPACKECIVGTIKAAVDEGRWANIICPLCPNQLKFKDIAEFAAKDDFERYDRLCTRATLATLPHFRWCLAPGCRSGQIHLPGEQLLICAACGFKMCYGHQAPWHAGLSCAEHDAAQARRLRREEEQNRELIGRISKRCPGPGCAKGIEKVEGTCNHMTCRPPVGCGYEFCYECLVEWTGYGRRTTHKKTCSSYVSS